MEMKERFKKKKNCWQRKYTRHVLFQVEQDSSRNEEDDWWNLWNTCHECFVKFKNGEFSLKDKPHGGTPQESGSDDLQALLDDDLIQSMLDLDKNTWCKSLNSCNMFAKY